jgi:hypothetical protein
MRKRSHWLALANLSPDQVTRITADACMGAYHPLLFKCGAFLSQIRNSC